MSDHRLPPGVTLRRGFPPGQRARAAQIYWQAFGPKLMRVMGPDARALAFLERGLRADHCWAALDEAGDLIGLAGFKTPYGSFSGGSRQDLTRIYGGFGALWRAGLLRLLASEVDNQRFLIDGIAVAAGSRGKGIGRALLAALYHEAGTRGYHAIRLEVVDTNRRARALYEREGFAAIATDQIGPLRFAFGFSSATTMVRILSEAPFRG